MVNLPLRDLVFLDSPDLCLIHLGSVHVHIDIFESSAVRESFEARRWTMIVSISNA
jgi:hypothetical protein